jgi:hypothetical protein
VGFLLLHHLLRLTPEDVSIFDLDHSVSEILSHRHT